MQLCAHARLCFITACGAGTSRHVRFGRGSVMFTLQIRTLRAEPNRASTILNASVNAEEVPIILNQTL